MTRRFSSTLKAIDEIDFEHSILKHLQDSDGVLVIVSEYTFDPIRIADTGDWVRREIRTALELNKPIVLVCVEGLMPPSELPEDIRHIERCQGIKFYPDYFVEGVQKLAEFISKTMSVPLKLAPQAPTPVIVQPSASVDVYYQQLDQAIHFLDEEKYDAAISILEVLQAASYQSKFVSIESLLGAAKRYRNERNEALNLYREAMQAYREIAMLASTKITFEQAKSSWAKFRKDFPDYSDDPQGLAQRLISFELPLLEWCDVPGGMVNVEGRRYRLDSFRISKYLVTNTQFQIFLDSVDGYSESGWWDYSEHAQNWRAKNVRASTPRFSGDKQPRDTVCWYDAVAFSRWLSEKTALSITLPTEQQWQRAAQGDLPYLYPWGDKFDRTCCNTSDSKIKKTTPVDQFAAGCSFCGAYDMAGNLLQWCLTEYQSFKNNLESNVPRVVRGGAWGLTQIFARTNARYKSNVNSRDDMKGFRLVTSIR